MRLADLPATTSAFLRCAYAMPLLVLLAWWQLRAGRAARLDRRRAGWAAVAGLSFGADLVFWHISIGSIGAGLATVLGNTQVVLFPLGAWIVWRERPAARQVAVLPLLVVGIVLIAGVVGGVAYGSDPVLGAITGVLTGVAYSGYLLGLRAGAPADGSLPVQTLTIATFMAGLVAATCAIAAGTFDPAPSWPAHGWMLLLAWSCQVLAWLLIAGSLSRVAAARVSILLLVQPVTALLLGVLVLGEAPSTAQWTGAALVLVGVVIGARAPRPIRRTRRAAT
ncbi:MAG: DMT family transporter [Thermoleophilia bacterium]|nr:DMT family transporter [Thermoleophilia bacterium]